MKSQHAAQKDLIIRLATPEDAPALAEQAARTFRETFLADNDPANVEAYVREAFTVERIRAELASPTNTFLLAAIEGHSAPIGYGKLREGPPEPCVRGPNPVEIERLYVDRKVKGQGVGAALMRALLDEAAARGYETVWLGVWERNTPAIGFYRGWGFEVTGSHVFQVGEDAQRDLIMERDLATNC